MTRTVDMALEAADHIWKALDEMVGLDGGQYDVPYAETRRALQAVLYALLGDDGDKVFTQATTLWVPPSEVIERLRDYQDGRPAVMTGSASHGNQQQAGRPDERTRKGARA